MFKTVTRQEEFEVSHILPGYEGGCGNLHGHSYKIQVTVSGKPNKGWGMLLDFSDLKKAIKAVVPDHMFIAFVDDPISMELIEVLKKNNLCYEIYPFETTAENMVEYYAEAIEQYIHYVLGHKDIEVIEVKLWETSNSFATWRR